MPSLTTMTTTQVIPIYEAKVKQADGAATLSPKRQQNSHVIVVDINKKIVDAKEGKVTEKAADENVSRRTSKFVFPKKIMADAEELKQKIKAKIPKMFEEAKE